MINKLIVIKGELEYNKDSEPNLKLIVLKSDVFRVRRCFVNIKRMENIPKRSIHISLSIA